MCAELARRACLGKDPREHWARSRAGPSAHLELQQVVGNSGLPAQTTDDSWCGQTHARRIDQLQSASLSQATISCAHARPPPTSQFRSGRDLAGRPGLSAQGGTTLRSPHLSLAPAWNNSPTT